MTIALDTFGETYLRPAETRLHNRLLEDYNPTKVLLLWRVENFSHAPYESTSMADEALENEIKCVSLAAAKLELKIKEEEVARRPGYLVSLLAQPPVLATLVAGLITAAGGMITKISSDNAARIEQEKTKNAEVVETAKARDAEKLEHMKFEGELIMQAIKTEDPNKKAENIEFLVQSGLLQDPPLEEKLNNYLKIHPPHAAAPAPRAQPK